MPETTEIDYDDVEVVKKIQEKVINLRWTITNFTEAYFDVGVLKSSTFHIGSNEFGLELDCPGEDGDTTFLFNLFQCAKRDSIFVPVNIDCKVWLEDLDGNKYYESEIKECEKYVNSIEYSFNNSFDEQDLRTTVKLRDDTAIFCAEIREHVPGDEIILPEVELELLQKLWNSCKRGLIDGINIQVEGKTFKVSKNILAIHSDVFERMFLTSNCKEVQEGVIEIKETRYEVMKAFIEYLHREEVNNLPDICDDLFVLAHKYLVVPLQEDCSKEMIESLTKENLFARLHLSFFYNQENLKEAVLEFVTSKDSNLNFRQIMKSVEWTKLENSNKTLANEIIDAVYDKMEWFPEQTDDQVPSKRQKLD